MPDLKLYTIEDLREWLINNNPPSGLNEHVIAPTRAYAILNNPYVRDDDAVVAAIYDNGELAAFTAAFPDMANDKRIWWFTTLSCKSKFEGKGYGLIVIGALAECYGNGNFYDVDGAKETIEIFQMLGLSTSFVEQYVLANKAINLDVFKGKLIWIREKLVALCKSKTIDLKNRINKAEYKIKYVRYIDSDTYSFICQHRRNDYFLRSREILNWIIQTPFMIESIVKHRISDDNPFSSYQSTYAMYAIQVYREDKLIGFYILRDWPKNLSVQYLYYDDSYAEDVFCSIAEHVLCLRNHILLTTDKELINFLLPYRLYKTSSVVKKSFSYLGPPIHNIVTLQSGDGDMFV